jgi:hypothetical protein
MENLGLMPSNTGRPGGKKTGQQMTHYVVEGGLFETVCKELLAENFKISWAACHVPIEKFSPSPPTGGEPMPKSKGRGKYTCAGCGAFVWGKPNLKIICGHCQREFSQEQD